VAASIPLSRKSRAVANPADKVGKTEADTVGGGSGSTLIAAEQMDRQCRMLELDEKYCDVILPPHGRYIGASSKPMTEYRKQPGERLGFNWMVPNVTGKRAIRHVIFDSNFWKSFIHVRLAVPIGDHGSLSFFGRYPDLHQLIAEHLTAEYRVKTVGRGRVVDEWKIRPERRDASAAGVDRTGFASNNMLTSTDAGTASLIRALPVSLSAVPTLLEFKPANRLKAPLRLSAIQSGGLTEANSTAKGTALRLSEVQKNRHLKVDY
jgi:hypothetical protein